jgi:hypothetical protein
MLSCVTDLTGRLFGGGFYVHLKRRAFNNAQHERREPVIAGS